MYAEVGPQVRCAGVMPPPNDDNVQYTSLNHDQSSTKDPAGMSIWTSTQISAQVMD